MSLCLIVYGMRQRIPSWGAPKKIFTKPAKNLRFFVPSERHTHTRPNDTRTSRMYTTSTDGIDNKPSSLPAAIFR